MTMLRLRMLITKVVAQTIPEVHSPSRNGRRWLLNMRSGWKTSRNKRLTPTRRVEDLEPRQKKRKDEEGGGYVWDTLFTPEVMLDDLPSSFRPFTFEYGRITDPWEHVCRFENTAQLHRISDDVKCCIFATSLTCAAQQWFVQLSGGSIPTFGRLCPMFLHHFANSRKHKKARLRSSALRNMRVSR